MSNIKNISVEISKVVPPRVILQDKGALQFSRVQLTSRLIQLGELPRSSRAWSSMEAQSRTGLTLERFVSMLLSNGLNSKNYTQETHEVFKTMLDAKTSTTWTERNRDSTKGKGASGPPKSTTRRQTEDTSQLQRQRPF